MATAPVSREKLMALPSLSNSLSSLPQATTLDGLSLHANFTTTVQHTADSAAKLQKALQYTAARSSENRMPTAGYPAPVDPSALTMRKTKKFSI